jgi:hypothetical protein
MSAAEKSGYFTRPSKASVVFAEEKAWVGFYDRIADSAVAEEVIQYLDSNPDERHQHPALYLRAKESMRRNEQRLRRAQRIGRFVRSVVGIVVIGPVSLVAGLLRGGRQIGLECLPEVRTAISRQEPARRRVGKLARETEFAQAKSSFKPPQTTESTDATARLV